MRLAGLTVLAALSPAVLACGGDYHTFPTFPTTAATTSSHPAGSTQWAGTLDLSSVSPSDSCEAVYIATHPELLSESATGDVQVRGDALTLMLRASGGQTCTFSGTVSADGSLNLSARDETCTGRPMNHSLIGGIITECHAIDPLGDGPYWGPGTLRGTLDASRIEGHWTFQVYDGGGGPDGSMVPFRVTLDQNVHLQAQ